MDKFNGPLAVWLKKLLSHGVEDPWVAELSEKETKEIFDEGNALCVNCVHPDSNPRWFCDYCGCPTGHYSPYMPFVYLYWIGWLFRSGVDGSVKLTKFRVLGFMVTSLMEYGFFVPLYWYRLAAASRGRYIQDKKVQTKREDQHSIRGPYEYEKFTWKELMEVYDSIDRELHSERFEKLTNEIEKRKQGEPSSGYNSD